MNRRSKKNRNLTLMNSNKFRGLDTYVKRGSLCVNYLEKIYDTIDNALEEHPRTMAIRIDLRFPKFEQRLYQPHVVSDFIRSLESQIKAEQYRKEREGERVHKCTVRYVWVKEKNTALNEHYHLALLFNKDRYNWLGRSQEKSDTLLSKIVSAWARTIDVDYSQANGLVYVSKDRDGVPVIHRLNKRSEGFTKQLNDLFKHASYLAKESTKNYAGRKRNFGCSRK